MFWWHRTVSICYYVDDIICPSDDHVIMIIIMQYVLLIAAFSTRTNGKCQYLYSRIAYTV